MDLSRISRPGVVLPVHVDPEGSGGPTPGQARGPRWRQVAPGWYVPSPTDSGVLDQRIVEAVAGTPADAVVTGWASLAWRRAQWFNGLAGDGRSRLAVPVGLPRIRGVRKRNGVEFSEDWLFPDDVEEVDGLRLTCPLRAVSYEACRARTLPAAVRTIDLAAAGDLVDLESLADYASRLISRPGVRLFKRAVGHADENVWSPQEPPMRLVWKAHVPRPLLTNRPLFDRAGRHLITPDLLDEEAGVVGEYDGAVHLEHGPRRRDLDRDALYRDLRLELVTMMSSDRRDTDHFVARLAAAYQRAAERRGSPRTWTTEQPAWWVDTSTVARRRALTADQRAIWLRRLAN